MLLRGIMAKTRICRSSSQCNNEEEKQNGCYRNLATKQTKQHPKN